MEVSSCRRKILVALDESDEILLWAIENLLSPHHSLNGSSPSDQIVLLHVQPSAQIFASDLEEMNEYVSFIRKNQDEVSQRILRHAKSICNEHGLCNEMKLEVGDPRNVICEVVDKIKPSFLILGSHGHGVLKRAFLGSVSDYCAHYANCPVFIVKKR